MDEWTGGWVVGLLGLLSGADIEFDLVLFKHTCSDLFVGGDTTRHIFIGDCVNSSLCFISPIKNGFLLRLKRVEVVLVVVVVMVVEDDGDVSGCGDSIFD